MDITFPVFAKVLSHNRSFVKSPWSSQAEGWDGNVAHPSVVGGSAAGWFSPQCVFSIFFFFFYLQLSRHENVVHTSTFVQVQLTIGRQLCVLHGAPVRAKGTVVTSRVVRCPSGRRI